MTTLASSEPLTAACTYRTTFTSTRRGGVKVQAFFEGNSVLNPKASASRTVRAGGALGHLLLVAVLALGVFAMHGMGHPRESSHSAMGTASQATALRARGADVVIVTAHAGGRCTAFDRPDDLSSCDPGEILDVARGLPRGLVDVGCNLVEPVVERGPVDLDRGLDIRARGAQPQALEATAPGLAVKLPG